MQEEKLEDIHVDKQINMAICCVGADTGGLHSLRERPSDCPKNDFCHWSLKFLQNSDIYLYCTSARIRISKVSLKHFPLRSLNFLSFRLVVI